MVISWFALFVCVGGALLYGLTNGKPSELGRISFAVGLLVLTMHLATAVIRIG